MNCPKCKLTNPPEAIRCDCGYDFNTKTMQKSFITPKPEDKNRQLAYEQEEKQLIKGAKIFIDVAKTILDQ